MSICANCHHNSIFHVGARGACGKCNSCAKFKESNDFIIKQYAEKIRRESVPGSIVDVCAAKIIEILEKA